MNRFHAAVLRLTPLALLASAALASSSAGAQTTATGGMLRNKASMTLYTFDKDAAGESRCYGGCAAAWPPFLASPDAQAKGPLTLLARKGGEKQWAYKGLPLYTFAGDAKPGDANGNGSGGVWHVIKVDPAD